MIQRILGMVPVVVRGEKRVAVESSRKLITIENREIDEFRGCVNAQTIYSEAEANLKFDVVDWAETRTKMNGRMERGP